MIKKMRRRMIMAAMLAFFAVIMMIAVMVNIVNYALVTKRADDTVNAILTYEEKGSDRPGPDRPPAKPFMGLPDVEANFMTRFFTVRFDSEGNVLFASTDYIAAIDSDTAVEYAREVLNGNRDHGYMKAYRFARDEVDDTTVIVFLNTTMEQQSMIMLLVLTLIVSFVSLIIVFILVRLLSARAIRPYAANIKQQKQFITDASHELKTPLTSILTSLDIITMERGDDEWTDNIRKQTVRMSQLVSELVTLSRFDEEAPLPNKEHFSLSDAAHETVEVYIPQTRAHDRNFTFDIEDNVTLLGDQSAIQLMLSTLLDNAIRYSDEKGDIRLSVFKKANRVNIEVFNTCHYDEPPDVDRLFDRFYRPDASRSTKTGGNGVGLSIARAVTLAHGGKISASCPSGRTMTIKISF